jgi:hypothetical protein
MGKKESFRKHIGIYCVTYEESSGQTKNKKQKTKTKKKRNFVDIPLERAQHTLLPLFNPTSCWQCLFILNGKEKNMIKNVRESWNMNSHSEFGVTSLTQLEILVLMDT